MELARLVGWPERDMSFMTVGSGGVKAGASLADGIAFGFLIKTRGEA
jgi:hypothetical protein